MSIKLLIADDEEMVREGIVALVEDSDIEVVGQAANADEAVRMAKSCKPDVAMLDVRMNDSSGLDALGQIRRQWPELPVIMFSVYNHPSYLHRAAELGAQGYLPKGVGRDRIIDAVRSAAAGKSTWSREELRRSPATRGVPSSAEDVEVPLTAREKEVLELVSNGLTNKEIADRLKISHETVKEHVQHILRKLALYDRTQVAVWAVRNGMA